MFAERVEIGAIAFIGVTMTLRTADERQAAAAMYLDEVRHRLADSLVAVEDNTGDAFQHHADADDRQRAVTAAEAPETVVSHVAG